MPKQISQVAKEKELPTPVEEKLLEEAEARLEIEHELKSYIERVEEEPTISNDLKPHIHSPAQAASQVLQTGPTIVLPLTEEEIKKGLHSKIWDSILWLATWCLKIGKVAHRLGIRVIFGRVKRGEPS